MTTHVALSRHAEGGPFRQRVTRRLVPLLYPRADAVVGVSKGVVGELERHIGPGRARTVAIYNPVVPDESEPDSETAIRPVVLPDGCHRMLLSVGRLMRQKNHALLIDAAARVLKRDPDTCLVILGEGPERPRLEERIDRHGLSERVLLPGFVRDPGPYYRSAALFVLSSDWEGLPTVLIEALSHGCPVVSTRCPSGPEEILEGGRFGLLVEPGDVDEMVQAITAGLAQPVDTGLLRSRARDFGFARAVDEYLELLFPSDQPISALDAT